jgi:hypothetical protein
MAVVVAAEIEDLHTGANQSMQRGKRLERTGGDAVTPFEPEVEEVADNKE